MVQNFADMEHVQRARWLNWAAAHNWGSDRAPHWAGRDHVQMTVYGIDETTGQEAPFNFSNPRDLRDWAGY